MRRIPCKLIKELENDVYYKLCARLNRYCVGRITWEHVFIYAGKQINERWAILPLCWHHHLGAGLNKKENEKIAIKRATKRELAKYPRRNWNNYRGEGLIGK